jgi:hypothetical protein
MYVSNESGMSLSVIKDTALVGIAEGRTVPDLRRKTPTIARNVLYLPPSHGAQRYSLFSLSGRKVTDLLPGENDIRHVPAGIYFIKRLGSRAVTKLVIQH